VRFLGLQTDISSLLRQADLLVFLTGKVSKEEAFGLVVVEAMASGCLSLVSNIGGPAEIVSHGMDGWTVSPHDKKEVLKMIGDLIELYGSRQWEAMRVAARQTVETRFSALGCVEEYERIYLDLIEAKGRRTKRGLTSVDPPPEVDLTDCIFLFHEEEDQWDLITKAIKRMASRKEPLKVPLCAWAARELARRVVAHGRNDLAALIYQKLYDSGFRDADLTKEWMLAGDPGVDNEASVHALVNLEPENPEQAMLAAEGLLKLGRFMEALGTIEKGERRFPETKELHTVKNLLRQRLGAAMCSVKESGPKALSE
jgi:hypothetical protein